MKTPCSRCKATFIAVAFALAVLSIARAAVVVDGITFSTITSSTTTGRMEATGGSSLSAYGAAGTATNDTQSVYTQFAPVTLAVGQSVRVEMTMTNLNFVVSAAGFRLSFSNMPASTSDVTYANPNWASGTRQGYNLWVPTVSSGASEYHEFFDLQNPLSGTGSNNPLLGAGGATFLPNGNGSTTIVFEVTRNSLTSVQLSGSVGSTQLATITDSASPYFTFNTLQFGVRGYNSGLGFTVDNITVVPEPSTVALAGVGLSVFLLGLRRRHRVG